MDCNRDEAVRAREIAEKKIESKDYTEARKFVLKAQKLNPDAENISQMLMVCDVHCAAEKKLFGNEMDWYAILQIEQTATEATIRKQYRKYALLLHPDKNKFVGAEAAFKLVGEAQRVLLDHEKRRLHDIRRKPAVPYRSPHRAASTVNVGVQANLRNNFTSFIPPHQPPQQQGHSDPNRATFWTVCPFCLVRYQYYIEVVNRSLCCQNCKKPFVAYDMELQRGHPQPMSNLNQTSSSPQPSSFNHRTEMGSPGNTQFKKRGAEAFQRTRNTSGPGGASEKYNGKKKRMQSFESSESCDTGSSFDSEENVVTDENSRKDVGSSVEHHPRRSSRRRQKISYHENGSDDGFEATPKKSKGRKPSDTLDDDVNEVYADEASKIDNQYKPPVDVDYNQEEINEPEGNTSRESKRTKESHKEINEPEGNSSREGKKSKESHKEINEPEGNSSRESKRSKERHKETAEKDVSQRCVEPACDPEPNLLSCHDPDFNDFDKLRNRECFSPGQIWAMYDDIDTMPRFYAWIKKAFLSGFKFQITWLEPKPEADDGQMKHVDKKLPITCGDFVYGATETMTDCGSMFSHVVSWDKGCDKDSFKIFPRKGETWALYKNWDKNSNYDPNSQYEYEFVETLSEYTKEAGIDVALLAKVKGFASLFCRRVKEGEKSFNVPTAELLRFSHKVPSFPLTGDEREDVPKGSFELDPAALPPNLPEISILEHLKEMADETDNTPKPMVGHNGDDAAIHAAAAEIESYLQSECDDANAPVASSGEVLEIPDPEFHNFDIDKSSDSDKFKIGQVWALYSDEDALPRYYGLIKKITREPEFEVKLTWLESSALPANTIKWHDKGMSISCGKFRPQRRTVMHCCNSTGPFSHLVRIDHALKKEFSIYPRKGEVWALYKNWTPEIKCSDLDKCLYDIVEVIEENNLQKEVMVLERVDGYNSVFKAGTKKDGSKLTMVITQAELLRFSHQIPAFRLTNEKGGSLKGCFELDPAALPAYFFPRSN